MMPPPVEKTFPVTVTNTGDKELVDSFDGEEFSFPPKKSVTIPSNVARHIFGYDLDDKLEKVIRLGWTQTSKDIPQAMARLRKFRFEPEEGTRRLTSPVAERVPLNASKDEAGGKLLTPAA